MNRRKQRYPTKALKVKPRDQPKGENFEVELSGSIWAFPKVGTGGVRYDKLVERNRLYVRVATLSEPTVLTLVEPDLPVLGEGGGPGATGWGRGPTSQKRRIRHRTAFRTGFEGRSNASCLTSIRRKEKSFRPLGYNTAEER